MHNMQEYVTKAQDATTAHVWCSAYGLPIIYNQQMLPFFKLGVFSGSMWMLLFLSWPQALVNADNFENPWPMKQPGLSFA